MIILGIETSCDETALALLECEGTLKNPSFKVIAEELYSQIEIHKQYGGVFPMLAKREHGRNLIPLFRNLLQKAGFNTHKAHANREHPNILKNVGMLLEREPDLQRDFPGFVETLEKPPIDLLAVTAGPGLEPALWVGINFAKALSTVWNIPVMPMNHMEGHLFSVLVNGKKLSVSDFTFPMVALLVSGGHTDLIFANDWLTYEHIGTTRDDAVGEVFDKVARMLGLPYPGGPEISRLAKEARDKEYPKIFPLPRPMLWSKDLDFSFSGLKTAVLYKLRELGELTHKEKASVAREFEDAAVEVLVEKTRRALLSRGAKTLITGGGVIANAFLRENLEKLASSLPGTKLLIPEIKLSTDNAVMIAAAAYLRLTAGAKPQNPDKFMEVAAHGSARLA